jgi:uncharacterized protein (TIGR02996 family)
MSDTERGLLAAVAAAPADDTPRLVYADWLDEHGQPDRAELIRVECRLEHVPDGSEEFRRLERRAADLYGAHEEEWLGPLAVSDMGEIEWHSRRGFIEAVDMPAGAFVELADELFARHPLVTDLFVTEAADDWEEFFACRRLRKLSTLGFGEESFDQDAAEALCESPHLGRLAELDLSSQPLGWHGMEAVSDAPLAGLERLSVYDSGIEDRGAAELFAARAFRRLRELSLGRNDLTDRACEELARATGFTRLETLNLAGNRITADGAAVLAAARHLGRLRSLSLDDNRIGPLGAAVLAESPNLGRLSHLSVNRCRVGPAGVARLRERFGRAAVHA